jgi:hypothetical protein
VALSFGPTASTFGCVALLCAAAPRFLRVGSAASFAAGAANSRGGVFFVDRGSGLAPGGGFGANTCFLAPAGGFGGFGFGATGLGGGLAPPGPEKALRLLFTGAGRSARSGISTPRGGVGRLLTSGEGGATPITVRFTFLLPGAGGPATALGALGGAGAAGFGGAGLGAAGFFEGLAASAGPTSPEG